MIEIPHTELPLHVCQPSDLEGGPIRFFYDGALSSSTTARIGFCFNWPAEIVPGKIEGGSGLDVEAGLDAILDLEVSGCFEGVVWLDARGRLRLQFFCHSQPVRHLSVRARLLPSASAAGELTAALLGVHEAQWLEHLIDRANGGLLPALAPLAAQWGKLASRPAALLWRAAGDSQRLSVISQWVCRITDELGEQRAFSAALGDAIDSLPAFRDSAAAEWIEATAGSLLSAAKSPRHFEKLREASAAAHAVLGDARLAAVLAGLKDRAARELAWPRIAGALADPEEYARLDAWAKGRLERFSGGRQAAAVALDLIRPLEEQIRHCALTALSNRRSAELSRHCRSAGLDTPLFDLSFSFTEEGLRAYRRALEGNLGSLQNHASFEQGVCAHGLARRANLGLELPWLDRKEWSARLPALAGARVEATADGRVVVSLPEAPDQAERRSLQRGALVLTGALDMAHKQVAPLALAFNDRRRLLPAQAEIALAPLLRRYGFDAGIEEWLETALAGAAWLETELSLSLPGEALSVWMGAPSEGDSNFGSVYTELSVAVQQALRRWLPYLYFSDLSRYDSPGTAYPLIVYQCTLPYRSKTRDQFAYDVMNLHSVAAARRSTRCALRGELERISHLLVSAGRNDTARFYKPSRGSTILASVERTPRLLNSLLAADAFLVSRLIRLGVCAGGLRRSCAQAPQKPLRHAEEAARQLVSGWHRRLRYLYPGQDFTALGPLLLMEATAALNSVLKRPAAVAAVVRLRVLRKSGADPLEQTFANSDFHP